MRITRIVFDDGIEVTGISQDTSDRIGLLLFAKPMKQKKVETKTIHRRQALPSAYKKWSSTDDETIRAHYKAAGAIKLAKSLGRTVTAVRQRASDLGVTSKRREKILEQFPAFAPVTNT